MNIKTATIQQLEERKNEIAKEFEKNKTKLINAYKKLDSLYDEFIEINNAINERK